MHRRDPDLSAEGSGGEGRLDISHCREELRDQALVVGEKDLIADVDEGDLAGRVERDDVRLDPLSRHVGIGGEAGNVAVGDSDDDADSGVGQGLDDGRIGSIEADLLDGGGLEELRGGRRRREVVGDLAVVDADEGLRHCGTESGD